jgi:glycosyltransferase involved in cell wall biosynthesis
MPDAMERIAVSAIIPTYNRVDLLPRAMDSALAALSPGDELIVVDDGSTDATVAVVEGYGESARLLTLDHQGAGPARNAGLAAAKHPLVAFLDSDDEWHRDKIELQRRFMEARPEVLYCTTNFGARLRRHGGEHHNFLQIWVNSARSLTDLFGPGVPYSSIAELPNGRKDFDVFIDDLYPGHLRHPFITNITLMIRNPVGAEALVFADDLPTCEELPAFGRLTKAGVGALFDVETAWQNGHYGARLTSVSKDVWADAWLAGLERVWGSDPAFLAVHGDEYRAAVAEVRLLRSIALAREGDRAEARRALALARESPRALVDVWMRTQNHYRKLIEGELARNLHSFFGLFAIFSWFNWFN